MRKGTTALSAGALALALSGGATLLVSVPASASAQRPSACDPAGPLSVLTGPCTPAARDDAPAGPPAPLIGTLDDLAGGRPEPATETVEDRAEGRPDHVTETVDDLTGARPGPVGETVDDLTGGHLAPVTEAVDDLAGGVGAPAAETVTRHAGDEIDRIITTLDETADRLLGGGGDPPPVAEPTAPGPLSSPTPTPPAEPDAGAGLLDPPVPLDARCLPVVAPCEEDTATPAPSSPQDRSTLAPAPGAPRRPGDADGPSAPGPTPGHPAVTGGDRPRGAAGGHGMERSRPSSPASPVADAEAPPLTPLWPGHPLPALADDRLRARQVVPGRHNDAVGTVLTAVLLASAILAARLVHARRRTEGQGSMPFEGLRRSDPRRERLA
ncbi:hypothetical protein [Sphaerisporangium sp. TRM90804]|uniref:hypothetical protein n=1 Tax=Sphaerisporangium sp. TRM90804 TaxID=3031113 RepID=UPI00244AE74C|nr:hypothetical protein [Sphaerisporangium sp. TRM90804]MDH2430174.1 hypothetical protein [Sphaerisporangium sp. TRM90804]